VRKNALNEAYREIDRTAMDALLFGLLKSLDYMGEKRQALLDMMESAMIQYLRETGTIASSGTPGKSGRSLTRLLANNGYSSNLQAHLRPRARSSLNLIETLAQAGRRPGGAAYPKRSVSGVKDKVDWILYEAVLYAMTKALDDQLGVQGQLILDRIGTSMLDYLVNMGAVKRSDDGNVLLQRVIEYFVKAGYAKSFRFELEGAPPDTFVSRYESARYYTNVFRRTQNEGSALLACPLCVIGHSIWATKGWRFGDVFEVRISSGGNVLAKARIYPAAERFTEKDALRFSKMKVQPPS